MGSSTTTTSSSEKNPWAPAVGNLKGILDQSQDLAGRTNLWQNNFSDASKQGLGLLTALGAQPSFGANTIQGAVGMTQPGMADGVAQLRANASGQNLDPNNNPYFRQSVGNAMQDASDMVQSQFAGAGRLGSGANTKVLTDRLGNIANSAYANQYNTNLGYQNQSANTLGQLGLSGAGLSGNVGALQAQQAGYGLGAGQMIDANTYQNQQAPINALNWQTGITAPIAGLGGNTNSTSTQENNPGIAGTIGGLGMMGAGLMTGGASLGFSGLLGGGVASGLSKLTGLNPGMGNY